MTGIIVNPVAIVVGACLGLLFKHVISEKVAKRCEQALAFSVVIIGIKMALKFENVLALIFCVCAGGVLGSFLKIEEKIEKLATNIESRFSGLREGKFAFAFSTSSILYCTGAMAVIGAINSGVSGNHEVLFAKSLLDGISSITFAAIYGIGVAFSAIPVLLYQGAIAIAASQLKVLAEPHVLNEISGVGGVLLTMIGISLLGIKKIPVGDYVPALPLAMIVAAIHIAM